MYFLLSFYSSSLFYIHLKLNNLHVTILYIFNCITAGKLYTNCSNIWREEEKEKPNTIDFVVMNWRHAALLFLFQVQSNYRNSSNSSRSIKILINKWNSQFVPFSFNVFCVGCGCIYRNKIFIFFFVKDKCKTVVHTVIVVHKKADNSQ